MKRFISYAFFDRQGIVDDYVYYLLEKLQVYANKIVFTSNGSLKKDSKEKLERLGIKVVERENSGYDITAHKECFIKEGWDSLSKYDEIIAMNDTIYGPIFPLDEMFSAMDDEEIDFWGITKHPEDKNIKLKDEIGYIPEHIQSYFIAVRNRLIISEQFQSYWEEMQEIKTYDDAVLFHEKKFTKYFEDKGFKWKTYVNDEYLYRITNYPLLYMPKETMERTRCPFIKKRLFSDQHKTLVNFSYAEQCKDVLHYIREETDYDDGLILNNLIRTSYLKNLQYNLNLFALLDEGRGCDGIDKDIRTAVVLYASDNNKLKAVDIQGVVENTDILTILANEKEQCRNLIEAVSKENIILRNYDYVTVIDLTSDNSLSKLEQYEAEKRNKGILLGLNNRIINTFRDNSYIGLQYVATPYLGRGFKNTYSSWKRYYDSVTRCMKQIDLDCPIDREIEPATINIKAFFVKGDIFEEIVRKYNQCTVHLNNEELGILLPLIIQNCGYLIQEVSSKENATNDLINYQYFLSTLEYNLSKKYRYSTFDSLVVNIRQPYWLSFIKKRLDKIKGKAL